MEVAQLNGRFLRAANLTAATSCAIVAVVSLWQAARWQNSIRELMELDPVDTAHPFAISLIALAVFAVLIALARFFRLTLRFVTTRVRRFLPARVSNVVGVIATVALFVRFMNQHGEAAEPSGPNAAWGPVRIVYLQYASDPATFFDYRSLYREPDWMLPPRGPDVSPQLRWYPVITLFQLMLDMFMATDAPIGFGHVYAPAHYIDAWVEVTDVRDWSPEEITRLKQHLSKPQAAPSPRKREANADPRT
jgi:uncharacterized membrane protein